MESNSPSPCMNYNNIIYHHDGLFSGQTKAHEEVIEEPWPLAQRVVDTETFISTLPLIYDLSQPDFTLPDRDQIVRDNTTSVDLLDGNTENPTRANALSFVDIMSIFSYQLFLNDIEEMCPLWIAKCPLVSNHYCCKTFIQHLLSYIDTSLG